MTILLPPVPVGKCLRDTFLRAWLALSVACALGAARVQASYGIYAGKNVTADGSVFLAGYGDEPSSHWLGIVPRREHPEGTMILAGADRRAQYPGELIQIPQARETFRYLTMNHSSFAGFTQPLSNGGLNEHHVAGRDIWSPSRDELRRMTPNPQRGLNYSDLSRIAMERARTAREAVRIIGDLMNQHGYATYGGNSHLFADADEGWIVINFAGGKGLWVAQRLGPDDIRVSRPGYVGEIPSDFQNHPGFMGSSNLIQFAIEQGWYDPASGEPFNVNKIYGDGQMRHPLVVVIKRLFYLVKEHEEKFLPEVTGALEAFESRLIGQQSIVEQTALILYKADQPDLARRYLTYHSQTEAMSGLHLGQALAGSIEARTKVLYGIRQPAVPPQPKPVKP